MSEFNDKVSIIIPMYNCEKYIEECIETVENQTYTNFEIILIDDGSTDGTYNIAQRHNENNEKIKLKKIENSGPYYARMEGLKLSTGEYVMFVDSDDYIDKVMLEEMISLIKKYNADICRCGMEVNGYKQEPEIYNITDKECYFEKKDFYKLIYNNFINGSDLCSIDMQLIKKKKLINNKNVLATSFAEDLQFNLNLYSDIDNIVLTEKNYYHYRKTQNSITTSMNYERLRENVQSNLLVYLSLFDYIKKWNIDNEENRKMVAQRVLIELTFNYFKVSLAEDANYSVLKNLLKEIYAENGLKLCRENILKNEIQGSNFLVKEMQKGLYDGKTIKVIAITYIYQMYKKLLKKNNG